MGRRAGERRELTLAQNESILWTGDSPPPTRRGIVLVVLVVLAFYGVFVLIGGVLLNQWEHLPSVLIATAASVLIRPFLLRRTLTEGRYTVTTQRIVVQNSCFGIRFRREERHADLVPPELVEIRGVGAVRFGDIKASRLAGHRAGGAVIFPLVLRSVSGAAEAFNAIRQARSDLP